MASAGKAVDATPGAQKPEVAKDSHTKTSGTENHDQLKHEYVSSVTDIGLPDPIHAHGVNRLREVVAAALKSAFAKQDPLDPRTRFHEQFRKEADEYDHDFHNKYHDDLNTTLIFVGSFQ
jgi:hypothetical protein